MNPMQELTPISSNLLGMWAKIYQSPYEIILIRTYRLVTLVIYLIIFLYILSNINLVLIAAFLIAGTVVLILEGYTHQNPYISFPLSQMIILLLCSYIQFFILLAEADIFDIIDFPLIPDLSQMVLGLLITLRIFIGIGLIRVFTKENSRIILSDHYQEALNAFKARLMYYSKEVIRESSEMQTKYRIKSFMQYVLFSISIVFTLLIPMWMNIFLSISTYPYILLILGAFFLIISIYYLSPKGSSQKDAKYKET